MSKRALVGLVVIALVAIGMVYLYIRGTLEPKPTTVVVVSSTATPAATSTRPVVEISIVYAPEYEGENLFPQFMAEFNNNYDRGVNPLTGQRLSSDDQIIHITGKPGSSGTVMQAVANAIIAPNNANVERPTIWIPSVGHWLSLANYETGRNLFDLANTKPTGNAPVVVVIWESRLKALQDAYPGQDLGWEELLALMEDPQGWESYGVNTGRAAIYYAHTNPLVSSTGLSTYIAEYNAAMIYHAGLPSGPLTLEVVNNLTVQEGVKAFENSIKLYMPRTTEMRWQIAQGTAVIDFTTIELNDVMLINQQKPPERLVALFPKEGTFIHEHPFGIPNADWVSDEQRDAADIFLQYILSPSVQRRLMEAGFIPVNPEVKLGYPFVPELGVDPTQAQEVNRLEIPEPKVMAALLRNWSDIKKQSDVWLLVDVSGSMGRDDKLDQAKKALNSFVGNNANSNRVGLIAFSTAGIRTIVPMGPLETSRTQMLAEIENLRANGDTPMYDALIKSIGALTAETDDSRTKAIVLLSDGLDNASQSNLNQVLDAIKATRSGKSQVYVIPVAYGRDADVRALNDIARASDTQMYAEDPGKILDLLQAIARYF